MKKTSVFIGCMVLLSIGRLPAQAPLAPGKLTLKQAVEIGLANNMEVSQADIQARVSEIAWKQAKLDRYPDLNGSISHGVNQGRSIDPFTNNYINQTVSYSSYGVSGGVILFNGLGLQNRVKQNALAYQASKMDLQQAKDNLAIDIILAYLDVLTNEDVLEQLRNQALLSKKQVERLEVMNKDGAISPSQLSDLRGQYANDQLGILNAEYRLETSRLLLCGLMNIPYDKNIQPERMDTGSFTSIYEGTPGQVYQSALQNFPLVKAGELSRQSAEKGVKAAKGFLFPTLSLNGNINTNYSNAARNDVFVNTTEVVSSDYVLVNGNPTQVIRKRDNYIPEKIAYGKQLNNNLFNSVSLNLRIPLFNSLQSRNQVKLAKLSLKELELQSKTIKTQLQHSVERAYIDMTSASERYRILLEQVDAFKESFRIAEIRFNAGLGTSIDYLTAKNNLDRANINLITAKYDHVLRTKVLDYYQGKQLW